MSSVFFSVVVKSKFLDVAFLKPSIINVLGKLRFCKDMVTLINAFVVCLDQIRLCRFVWLNYMEYLSLYALDEKSGN